MLLLLLLIHVISAHVENNACRHLKNYPIKERSNDCYVNSDVMALTPAIIVGHGYKTLSYNVTTDDGYNLQLFRILPAENVSRNYKTILLDHGLFHDSSSWVFVGKRSLAFNLAARGYDVWLANNRGTRYSRTSTKNDSDFEYWLYSLDTMAAYDIPASLEVIANVTGQVKSIIYVGHSRGTTVAFMYASEFPEHAQKYLRGIIALCPIVYFEPLDYVRRILSIVPALAKALLSLKISAVLSYEDLRYYAQYNLCSQLPYFCRILIDVTTGLTWQFLPEDLLVYVTHSPSMEPVMLILQYAQIAMSGKFQKFDYGRRQNLEKYGQAVPPLYHLENVTIPVYMFYGKNDIYIKRKAVRKIFDQLGSSKKKFWKIPVDSDEYEYQFSHNDFIWAKYLERFLYPIVFNIVDNEF